MKKRQKKKHCHGLTRNFTEKTEAETRNEEHIIRSQMRERRYKYTVWGGPFGKLRDQVPSVRSVSLSNWPLSSRRGKISFNISLGAKSKGSNGGVAVGLPHRNSSVFKQTPYQ